MTHNLDLPFAFYGILMERGGMALNPLPRMGTYGGPCVIPGRMYDVSGAYPALVPGPGRVTGQLWHADIGWEEAARHECDMVEGYRKYDEASSLYLRRRVRLIEPETEAWVYLWNRPTHGLRQIETGSWFEHRLAGLLQ